MYVYMLMHYKSPYTVFISMCVPWIFKISDSKERFINDRTLFSHECDFGLFFTQRYHMTTEDWIGLIWTRGLLLWYCIQNAFRKVHSVKLLLLFQSRKSYRFQKTWVWANEDSFHIWVKYSFNVAIYNHVEIHIHWQMVWKSGFRMYVSRST